MCSFSGADENGEPRYLMTEALQVSPGYMIQFDLVMGCGTPYTTNLNNQVSYSQEQPHDAGIIVYLQLQKPGELFTEPLGEFGNEL